MKEEQDTRQTHAHTTLPCSPPTYSTNQHHSSYSNGCTTTTQKYTYYNKQDAIMVRPQKRLTYTHSYTTTTRYNLYTSPLTQFSLLIANYKSTDMSRCCILLPFCMNLYMYVVSVDVPLWHLVCCNMCTFAW